MVAALLLHQDIDVTVISNRAVSAIWKLSGAYTNAKTLNWVRIFLSIYVVSLYKQALRKNNNCKGKNSRVFGLFEINGDNNFLVSKNTSDYEMVIIYIV